MGAVMRYQDEPAFGNRGIKQIPATRNHKETGESHTASRRDIEYIFLFLSDGGILTPPFLRVAFIES